MDRKRISTPVKSIDRVFEPVTTGHHTYLETNTYFQLVVSIAMEGDAVGRTLC